MKEKFRALERLANHPGTPPHEAAAARRILERLRAEGKAPKESSRPPPPPRRPPPPPPRPTVYLYIPGMGVFEMYPEDAAQHVRRRPDARVTSSRSEADAWLRAEYTWGGGPHTGGTRASSPRAEARAKKKAGASKPRRPSSRPPPAPKAKPPPKPKRKLTHDEKLIQDISTGFDQVVITVATASELTGKWIVRTEKAIATAMRKALRQARSLARQGYTSCIVITDGTRVVYRECFEPGGSS